MSELVCPTCPLCGSSPDDAGLMLAMISGGTQVICPNEACEVYIWDGSKPDGGASNAAVMEETRTPTGGTVSRPRDATPDELQRAREQSRPDR